MTEPKLKYYRSKKGFLTHLYSDQKVRSKRRGHSLPSYTKEELKEWLYKNNFNTLYKQWVESGFDKYTKPSVDRLDNNKGYTLNNIRLVTWKQNDDQGNKDIRKGILIHKVNPQLSVIATCKKTNKTIEFSSIINAERETGISNSNISKCCRGIRNSAGGYTWKYKH